VFLLGDIFDLWVADHQVFAQKWAGLVNAIERLCRRGVEVHYFEGNHDLHLKNFWEGSVGAWVHPNVEYLNLGPWRLRIEHGDLINSEEVNYRRLRAFLRLPQMHQLAYQLPGGWLARAGQAASVLSRRRTGGMRRRDTEKIRGMIRMHAHRTFRSEGVFDLIITGHMHVRDEYVFTESGRRAVSINLGSWFEEFKVLSLDDNGYQWKTLS
jgi:UDP-2,3-diacylglucosamine hydrolase